MNQQIQNLIDELCAIDPSFEKRREELYKILEAMMANKPKVNIDPEFVESLRSKLANTAAQDTLANNTPFLFRFNYLFSALGAAIVVVMVVILVQKSSTQTPQAKHQAFQVATVAPNAFGKLSAENVSDDTQTALGGAVPETSTAPATPLSSEAPNRMILPITRFTYKYTGDPLPDLPATVDVYKKVSGIGQNPDFDQLLNSLSFNSLNLGTFGQLHLQSFQAAQTTPYGYTLGFDGSSGNVYISQNYEQWPQPNGNEQPLQPSDVPSDDALIATSNQFLQDHQIDLSNYGQPKVQQNNFAISASDQPVQYVSDVMSVIYPLKIQDKDTYTQQGTLAGITVDVNIRYNKVTNVGGIMTLNFQSSAYAAEQDASKIIAKAEQGTGLIAIPLESSASGSGPKTKTIELKLGTPTLGYADYWQTNSDGSGSELYVPAYIFPIIGPNAAQSYQKNIVVPVIQDYIESNNQPSQVIPFTERSNAVQTPAQPLPDSTKPAQPK